MKPLRLPAVALAALLVFAADAVATTTLTRGIVVEVKQEKDRRGKEHQVIVIRQTWSNYHGEDSLCKVTVPPGAVILLDGELAEREAAMKPGHLVKALLDCS